jgi:hypothetical protein
MLHIRSIEVFRAMRYTTRTLACLLVSGTIVSACARRVPEPANTPQGTPTFSWIIMSGDRENPDRDWVCQSDIRSECVIPASRPEEPVFSDTHFYFRSAKRETGYTGSIRLGFLQGSPGGHEFKPNVTVAKDENIANANVIGIVTAMPGTSAMTFDLVAATTDTGETHQLRDEVPVVVE